MHEFLAMGPAVVEGDMNAEIIQKFFDVNAVVVVPAKEKMSMGNARRKTEIAEVLKFVIPGGMT